VDAQFGRTEVGKLLAALAACGLIDLRSMGEAPLTKAMLWRVAAAFDPDVSYVFCRDLDSPPMPRDRACMEQFIFSEAAVHTIHDAPVHIGIMGGLCGFRARAFRELTGINSLDALYKWAGNVDWARHGTDQNVLNSLVRARPRLTLLEHRYAGWYNGPGVKKEQERGAYGCLAYSTKVPDVGYLWTTDERASDQADRLGAHLGCAGYDHHAARTFWEKHGDPDIAQLVRECEGR
jgi:hypothetical protein